MDDEQQSLVDRAVRRLSASAPEPGRTRAALPAIDWRFALALTALIALGPLLTVVGAGLLERDARADAARLRAQAAPVTDAAKADRAARGLLRATVSEAPVALWLDRAARALPDEARISRMARSSEGRMEIDVIAPDPDPVRAAMRRDPAFTRFREAGQRRAGGAVLISYRQAR
jgi:hypothetical protein